MSDELKYGQERPGRINLVSDGWRLESMVSVRGELMIWLSREDGKRIEGTDMESFSKSRSYMGTDGRWYVQLTVKQIEEGAE